MADINLPPNIENYAKIVSDLESQERLSGEQKKKLAISKLRIALWACKTEGMPITRYSLAEILGPDTAFVFINAQSAMLEVAWESPEDRAAMVAIVNATRNKGGRKEEPKEGKKTGGLGTYR